MTVPTLFQGELQYVGFTDSSRGGPCLKFRLADRDDLQRFVGIEARRVAAVLVLLSDDEQPEPPPAQQKRPNRAGPLARLAGQWCATPDFQRWIGANSAEEAAEFVRTRCGITSRADLDHSPEAAERFHRLVRIPYSATLREHA